MRAGRAIQTDLFNPGGGIRFGRCPRSHHSTANDLTKAIIKYIEMRGGQAERITVTGRAKEVRDAAGRVVGVRWERSHMTVGTADISATIGGRSVKIEVKVGRDVQSEAQRQYQRAVERAGGIYYVAHDFEDFIKWYNTIF